MANTYSSNAFVIDTDTNIAGLETLKGSAVAATDDISIRTSSSNKPATLTVEKSFTCKSLNVGYTTAARTTASRGYLIINDGVVITFASGTYNLTASNGCTITANGTLHTIGTSNGAADQTFGQHDGNANQWGVFIDNEWWEYVPNLTGERIQCGTTSNSQTIAVATDPRNCLGLQYFQTIEIRKKSDGTLVGSRVITSMSSTTITVTGGNVTTDSSHYIYVPIAATDKVYTISGGNIVFGDGTASAWNNNGGAIPPNGSAIKQCGILLQSSTSAGWEFRTSGASLFLEGVETCYLLNANNVGTSQYAYVSHPTYPQYSTYMKYCASHHSYSESLFSALVADGLYFGYSTGFLNGSVTSSYGYGVHVMYSRRVVLDHMYSSCNYSVALYLDRDDDILEDSCHVYRTNYNAVAMYNQTCNDVLVVDSVVDRAGNTGIYFGYKCRNFVVLRCTTAYTNGAGIAAQFECRDGKFIDCTAHDSNSNGFYHGFVNKNIRVYNCRSYNTVYVGIDGGKDITSAQGGAVALRNTSSGNAGVLQETFAYTGFVNTDWETTGTSLQGKTKDNYFTTPPSHIPGIASFDSAISLTTTAYSSSTAEVQYRQSHDFGRTWTDWATITTNVTRIAETPDPLGEMIQFRMRKTDSGAGAHNFSSISVAITMEDGWTCPAEWSTLDCNARGMGGM